MGFASWQRYCTPSSSGRQPNFVVLNRGRHLCSAGRPSGWALAHSLVEIWAEPKFQQSLVDDVINQWQKRLEVCIHADGGHFAVTVMSESRVCWSAAGASVISVTAPVSV